MHAATAEDFDVQRLRERVQATYEKVAACPEASYHFHVGLDYAVRELGYPRDELTRLPRRATERFAGVGHPLSLGPVPEGATVLDHACGAGTDLLLAAARVGPRGRAIGVDLSHGMRAHALEAAREAGLDERVQVLEGDFAHLPLSTASVDVVLSNGVLNLAADKPRVLAEVARVLRPGGRLYLCDVVLGRSLAPAARQDADLWAACVGGALTEAELLPLLHEAGLVDGAILVRHDCFRGTSVERKFGRALPVWSASLRARKP